MRHTRNSQNCTVASSTFESRGTVHKFLGHSSTAPGNILVYINYGTLSDVIQIYLHRCISLCKKYSSERAG